MKEKLEKTIQKNFNNLKKLINREKQIAFIFRSSIFIFLISFFILQIGVIQIIFTDIKLIPNNIITKSTLIGVVSTFVYLYFYPYYFKSK